MSTESFSDEWEGIPVTYLKSYWFLRRPNSMGLILMPDIFAYRHLFEKADIVHIHGNRSFQFTVSTQLARYTHTPYVVQPRGSLPNSLGRSWVKRVFDRTFGGMTIGKATGAIALNNDERVRLIASGIAPERVAKILNPIDPATMPDPPDGVRFRCRFQIEPDQRIVLFLSRLHYKKGLDLLIEAFAKSAQPDWHLCIVGPDDGYEEEARRLINHHNLNELVTVTGPLYGQDKYDAYGAADVYVLPTRGVEGLPTTVLEACQANTPVISTRMTEVADLLDERIGLAIDFDVDQLATALSRILNDAGLRATYRANMAGFIREHFDLDTMLDRVLDLYETCLTSRRMPVSS